MAVFGVSLIGSKSSNHLVYRIKLRGFPYERTSYTEGNFGENRETSLRGQSLWETE